MPVSFASLSLNAQLQANIKQLGFTHATPVQSQCIPLILANHDLMACARTGTGKTAAYALPLMDKLLASAQITSEQATPKQPRCLILVPTRELAQQVQDNFVSYVQNTALKSTLVYGGVAFEPQQKAIQHGVDILIATPGRLLDHLRKRTVSLKQIAFLVFDEADRMLDMGFKDEINALLRHLPKTRQTLLFSATFDNSIFRFSKSLLSSPKVVEIEQRNSSSQDIEQQIYEVDEDQKTALLSHLLKHKNWPQVLVFSRTKQATDKLAECLVKQGVKAKAFHGDLSQKMREQTLEQFKTGQLQVLVATDVAARGLDIEHLPLVINMELPFVAEDYIHRIGRTGRAGNKGLAITFFNHKDARQLEEIEALLDTRIARQWYPGFEPDLTKLDDNPRHLSKAAQKQRARKRALKRTYRRKQ